MLLLLCNIEKTPVNFDKQKQFKFKKQSVVAEQQLKGIVATAQDLGLKDLLAAVTSVGLAETLVRGNFTVFAPVDGTFPLTTGERSFL